MSRFGVLLIIVLFCPVPGVSSIDSGQAVEIGGIKQWISIKGLNENNPVLLFLHGGPGNSVMSYAERFTNELQKHFVVVQWDQRGSGKTAKLNTSNKPLSVALMEEDALAMINYLRATFSQDKIYLMGHSWGGFLGLTIAAKHPEVLKACIAISPMVYQVESERLSLEWMINKAKEDNNLKALEELASVKIPFQNADQLYYHRNWLALTMGTKLPSKAYVQVWGKKWLSLFNEASQISFFTIAPEITCPIYFFVGRKDYQTHYKLAEDYFNVLKADKKQLFWFADSGHNLNLSEPKQFQEIIIKEILFKSDK
ncbi:MAG: alpha/beta hydrolase [Bacteroidota bacterium]